MRNFLIPNVKREPSYSVHPALPPPPSKKRENIGHTKNRVDIKLAKKSTKDTHIASGIAQQEK